MHRSTRCIEPQGVRRKRQGTDEWIEVETRDGGRAELHVADAGLLAFNYVWLSRDLAELMFAIAQNGYRVLGDNSSHALTTSPARTSVADSNSDWPVVLCSSPEAMYDALMEPFEEWVEYRDHVVSDATQGVVRRLTGRVRRR